LASLLLLRFFALRPPSLNVAVATLEVEAVVSTAAEAVVFTAEE
jgi:hypothetical protein